MPSPIQLHYYLFPALEVSSVYNPPFSSCRFLFPFVFRCVNVYRFNGLHTILSLLLPDNYVYVEHLLEWPIIVSKSKMKRNFTITTLCLPNYTKLSIMANLVY